MYIVAHNLPAMNTQRQFGINKKKQSQINRKAGVRLQN